MAKPIREWDQLVLPERELALAVHTEFEGTETITVQFAACWRKTIYVQVYHAKGVAVPDAKWFKSLSKNFTTEYGRKVIVRPVKPITHRLSPGRVLADALDLPRPEYLSRTKGQNASRTGTGGRRTKVVPCRACRFGSSGTTCPWTSCGRSGGFTGGRSCSPQRATGAA